jgi:hypothetical protein
MLIKPITFIQPDYRLSDLGIHAFDWRMPYDEIIHDINIEYKKNEELGLELLKNMAEQDFFFFCYAVMGIHYMNHRFIIARCYEYGDKLFENAIYLWAREHFKSSVITNAEQFTRKSRGGTQAGNIFTQCHACEEAHDGH